MTSSSSMLLGLLLAAAAAAGAGAASPGGAASGSGSSSSSASTAAASGHVVRVPLTAFQGTLYYGQLEAGTPPQRFRVMFATGSADTWLPSKLCATRACRSHARFAEAYSSTFAGEPHPAPGRGFNLTYSLGTLAALPGSDTLRVGGGGGGAGGAKNASAGAAVTVPGAAFARVTREDDKFQAQYRWLPFDGIVGLSYAGASVSRQRPLFDAMAATGQLRRNMFSLHLSQSGGGGKAGAGGQLILGGTDPKLHLDEVTFFPVEKPHVFWMVNVSRIALHESYAAAASPVDRRLLASMCGPDRRGRGCRAVVDSGTSLISGPSAAIRELGRHIEVDEACEGLDRLPVLNFQFYGKTFSLHPQDYVIRVPVGDSEACFLGLEAQDFPEQMGPMWVLGNVFLRKFYTVFDRDNDMLGFALARPT